MKLTSENKKAIDGQNYARLLAKWRFAPPGEAWLQGETGKYWGDRMAELRDKDPAAAVQISKDLGFKP